MNYHKIIEGEFVSRPNRFIAYVKIKGQEEICHVKNTGRCKELLIAGVKVYLEESDNPNRKTKYDLVAVHKGNRLINMDSQAPNAVVKEWIEAGRFLPNITYIKPEQKYGKSRLDFYVETQEEKIFIEVKGVTLEENGIVRFPDAPSERAIKHMEELIACKQEGYQPYIIFVVQMENVTYFTPNRTTHKAFAEVLIKAQKAGVIMKAFDCKVTATTLSIHREIPIILEKTQAILEKEIQ